MPHRIAIWIVGALVTVLASAASANVDAARQLTFDVFLDDRPIGYQRFELQPTRDGLRVETRAELEVTVLRLKTFAYDHRNVEQWRNGCLDSIASQTESNGRPYRVTGRASPDGFSVTGSRGSQRLTDCVGTFSYWDRRQLLQRSRLLNSQTGEYVAVESRSLGMGTLEVGGREVPVERYRIEGEDLEITLAYALDSGEWVALDSPLWGGWTLRYRRSAAELGSTVRSATDAPAVALPR